MDCGQTYDVVNTPPPQDKCYWPSPEDFQEREEIKNGVIFFQGRIRSLNYLIEAETATARWLF